MITIDPSAISERDNYKLLSGSIVPRPIAFVTTLSDNGVLNGAPFSYFSIVSTQPPMLSVSVGRKQGVMKDTARNAIHAGAFVVHVVDERNVEKVNVTAAGLPSDVSEVEIAGLTQVDSEMIQVPGVEEAKIRMECVLEQVIPLGGAGSEPANDLLIGRVVRFHLANDVYDPIKGYINSESLRPVGRMAGNDYAALGKLFSIERPR